VVLGDPAAGGELADDGLVEVAREAVKTRPLQRPSRRPGIGPGALSFLPMRSRRFSVPEPSGASAPARISLARWSTTPV
jgi:hypothetical protein